VGSQESAAGCVAVRFLLPRAPTAVAHTRRRIWVKVLGGGATPPPLRRKSWLNGPTTAAWLGEEGVKGSMLFLARRRGCGKRRKEWVGAACPCTQPLRLFPLPSDAGCQHHEQRRKPTPRARYGSCSCLISIFTSPPPEQSFVFSLLPYG
jgi:hypothetical protein